MPELARPPAALEVSGLSVRRGGRAVCCDVSFCLRFGELFAVLGPNGAGKSSLLRAVCGLLPSQGKITVQGADLRKMRLRARARRLAFVPQSPSLASPLPVREVVAQGRYAHRGASGAAADREALDRSLATASLQPLADRAFTQLSQGEKQRVMLARALCTGARILCLDEPTASLDVGHALDFYHLAKQLAGAGYAVLMVLHPLSDALRFADRALLMAEGARAALGPADQVVAAEPVRRVYGVEMKRHAGLEFERAPQLGAPAQPPEAAEPATATPNRGPTCSG